MIKRMAECGIKPSRIYYTCEGHAWENALVYSVRRYLPETKIIAYDNGTFSTMNLSMVPAVNEFNVRPMPDKIVTSGAMYAQTLRYAGYPEHMIEEGCGLRHPYLSDSTIPEKLYPDTMSSPPWILVATSIDFNESLEMIDKAIRVFVGGEPRVVSNDVRDGFCIVTVKLHPMVDKEKILACLGELPSNVYLSEHSLRTLLEICDVLLYTYSLVCFEALAYGVYPIFVKSENALNLDKLDWYGISGSAATPEEIKILTNEFLYSSQKEKKEWAERAKLVCRGGLGKIDDACVERFIR
jgi:hypothetical protein